MASPINVTLQVVQGPSIAASFSGAQTPDATATVKGKLKLAGDLGGTADSPTVPGLATKQTLDSDLTAIAALSPANDDIIQRKSGAWTNRTIAQYKSDLSLNNVDNTNDANKPISTATQTALDAKADDSAVVHNTGDETITGIKTFSSSPLIPSPLTDSQATPKSYVDTAGSSVLAYWDGINNPTSSSYSYPLATLTGNATFIDSSNGIRLTDALGAQNGAIEWNFVQAPFMRVQFNFKAGGGSGADGTWFYCFADATPTTEYGTGLTYGYIIYLSEYYDKVGITYGPFTDGQQGNAGGAGQPLATASLANIDNNVTHEVDVSILFNKITIRVDGAVIIDYSDVYTRDLTHTKFGFGARTGGSNNQHFISGLVVAKLGQSPGDYRIQNSPVEVDSTGNASIITDLNMNSKAIQSLADPTNDQDAATKKYVDNQSTYDYIVAPSGGDYTTLSAALAVAASGSRIFIKPGTYTETAGTFSTANLTIIGASSETVILNLSGNLTLSGNYLRLSGVTIDNGSSYETILSGQFAELWLNHIKGSAAAYFNSSGSYNGFFHNKFEATGNASRILFYIRNRIEGNHFIAPHILNGGISLNRNIAFVGNFVYYKNASPAGDPLVYTSGEYCTITGNSFFAGNGAVLLSDYRCTFSSNVIEQGGGTIITAPDGCAISSNIISVNYAGIAILLNGSTGAYSPSVTGNTITGNVTSGTVMSGVTGIQTGTTLNTGLISSNCIAQCETGIYIAAGSTKTLVNGNSIFAYTTAINDSGTGSIIANNAT